MKNLLTLSSLVILLTGCHHISVTKTSPDGSNVNFRETSLLSNTAVKGLAVDGTTKTTSNLLKITGGSTEPNPEAIIATGDALGTLIGKAIKEGSGNPLPGISDKPLP